MLYLLIPIIFLSCSSVRKMVDSGQYDQAINKSINKIKGKKNKKDKYVEAIESAFAKATDRDMRRIEFLKMEKYDQYWIEIFDILENMDARQQKIMPLLPLVSESGYKANFKFINVEPLIVEARESSARLLYETAADELRRAENGDKDAARKAYRTLGQLREIYRNYRDSYSLELLAYELGQERVLIDVKNMSDVIMPKSFYQELKNINTNEMNKRWFKFYTSEDTPGIEYDYIVNINMKEILIGAEREKEREYTETTKIIDGYEYVKDERGNVKKDSLGNDIKVDREVEVSATIFELGRFKSALVKGDVTIFDNNKQKVYRTSPINVETFFETFASSFRGDERALSAQSKSRLKNRVDPFPSNEEMIFMTVEDLKTLLYNEIDKNLHDSAFRYE